MSKYIKYIYMNFEHKQIFLRMLNTGEVIQPATQLHGFCSILVSCKVSMAKDKKWKSIGWWVS